MRSLRMGPPRLPAAWPRAFMLDVSVKPHGAICVKSGAAAWRRDVRLLACRLGFEPFARIVPENLLPPERGIAFVCTPSVGESPCCPDTRTSTCAKSSGEYV